MAKFIKTQYSILTYKLLANHYYRLNGYFGKIVTKTRNIETNNVGNNTKRSTIAVYLKLKNMPKTFTPVHNNKYIKTV